MNALEVEGVRFAYGPRQALDDVTFATSAGALPPCSAPTAQASRR